MKSSNGYRIKFVLVGFAMGLLSVGPSANADFVFGEPVNLGPPINTSSNEATFCLSADGLELYISSNRPGTYGIGDIWVSTRPTINDNWTEPVNLGPVVNSPFADTVEYISPDGLELYFDALNRTGGKGGWDIWMTKRATKNDPWSTPINMGVPFNTSAHDWKPYISSDNLTFYFTSMRPGGYGDVDIWVACRATIEEPWAEPVNLGPLVNSSATDSSQNISGDGLTLSFHSNRSGGYGALDLWMTTRRTTDDDWNIPVNLGLTVNTASDEIMPEISADGSVLYFCSTRPGGQGAWDIYQAPIFPVVDFNGDGIVDSADMCIVIDHWGENYPLCDIGPTPFGDGIVDVQDLIVVARHLFEEVLPVGLISYWKLDEAEGGIAEDTAGDNAAVLHGEPQWQPAGGMKAGALLLDGIDDYMSTGFVINPAIGPFSVFAWVKGGAPGQAIISEPGGPDWLSLDSRTGCLMTELANSGRGATILMSQTTIADGGWHRIGLVWDGVIRTLLVDGVAVAQDTQSNLGSPANGFYIGTGKAMAPGTHFCGLIDDVRIYNVPLSAEQIASLAQ